MVLGGFCWLVALLACRALWQIAIVSFELGCSRVRILRFWALKLQYYLYGSVLCLIECPVIFGRAMFLLGCFFLFFVSWVFLPLLSFWFDFLWCCFCDMCADVLWLVCLLLVLVFI